MVDLSGKANDFLNSDKGEQVSDSVLDKGTAAADKATGGEHDEQLKSVREHADSKLGEN